MSGPHIVQQIFAVCMFGTTTQLNLFQNEVLSQQEELSRLQRELDERSQTSTGQGQKVRDTSRHRQTNKTGGMDVNTDRPTKQKERCPRRQTNKTGGMDAHTDRPMKQGHGCTHRPTKWGHGCIDRQINKTGGMDAQTD